MLIVCLLTKSRFNDTCGEVLTTYGSGLLGSSLNIDERGRRVESKGELFIALHEGEHEATILSRA